MSNTFNKNTSTPQKAQYFFLYCVSAVTIIFLPEMADPFNTIKLIVLLLSSAWFLGHVISTHRNNPFKLKSTESFTISIVFFFIIAMFISTMLTDQRLIGLIGDTQRRNGFFSYLSLTIIFLYAYQKINFWTSLTIFKVACICALILSAYGFMQISGKDFIEWVNPYNNMISTLGNPNFASSMLAILILILLFGLFLDGLPKPYKIISACVIPVSFYAILISKSLQGVLVIAVAVMFYLVIFSHRNKIRYRYVTILISIIIIVLGILGMLQKGPLVSLLYKDSVSVRGYYWRAGWEMFRNNILTGVGVDSYGAYFKEYREAGYPLKYGFEIGSSNAHNVVIQLFSTAGIFTGISYLLIIGYVLLTGIKLIYKTTGQEQKITLAILSSWIGFNAQSIISIDNLGISVWGWLLGGSILGLSKSAKIQSNLSSEKKVFTKSTKLVQINVFQPLVSIIILVPTLLLSLNLSRNETDLYKLRSIIDSKSPENYIYAASFANNIINNSFSDPNYRFEAAMSLVEIGEVQKGSQAFSELMSEDPNNLRYLDLVARNEQKLGNLEAAIFARIKISEHDPWNVDNYLVLCELYFNSGNNQKANSIKDKILSFASDTLTSQKVNNLLEKS